MPDKLDDLEKRLEAAQKEFDKDYNPKPSKTDQGLNMGARAGIELVGSLLGGGLIGYLLDKWLETGPTLFIIFLILGAITAFYNIYKITINAGTSVGFKGLQEGSKPAKQSPDFKNQNDKND